MESITPLLFIYIPTFNRPCKLRKQVEILAPQIERNRPRVRLLVNDNASPGNPNDDLARKYSNDFIQFRKNPGNIGANANIALGFIFALKDEFLWILGDDDQVTENAVDVILNHIKPEFDFVFFDKDVASVTEGRHSRDDGFVGTMHNFSLGLISLALHNVNAVSQYSDAAFFYHNSSYPHVAVIYSTLRGKKHLRLLFVPRELVILDCGMTEEVIDASVVRLGNLQLATLMPIPAAKKYCSELLELTGISFFALRKMYPKIFAETIVTLIQIGGLRCYVLLIKQFFGYLIWRWPSGVVSRNHDLLKKYLKPLTPDFMKPFLRKFRQTVYYEMRLAENTSKTFKVD